MGNISLLKWIQREGADVYLKSEKSEFVMLVLDDKHTNLIIHDYI